MICAPDVRARLEALGDARHPRGRPDARRYSIDVTSPRRRRSSARPRWTPRGWRAAEKLRAIVNVEGNLLPNVDYDAVLRPRHPCAGGEPGVRPRGGRGRAGHGDRPVPRDHGCRPRDACGPEVYGLDSNRDAFLLQGAASASSGSAPSAGAARLLAPFGCRVRAHDPWQPPRACALRAPAVRARRAAARVARGLRVRGRDERQRGDARGARLDLLPDGACVCSRAAPPSRTSTHWWRA